MTNYESRLRVHNSAHTLIFVWDIKYGALYPGGTKTPRRRQQKGVRGNSMLNRNVILSALALLLVALQPTSAGGSGEGRMKGRGSASAPRRGQERAKEANFNSNTTTTIANCTSGSAPEVVRLRGGAQLVLGDGSIAGLHCSFFVFGANGNSNNENNMVTVNATAENKRRWQFRVLGNKLSVYLLSSPSSASSASEWGTLAFDVALFSIGRLVVRLGDGPADVLQLRGTAQTQTAWLAPPGSVGSGIQRTAQVESTTAAVLVAGAFTTITVGPSRPPAHIPGVNPLGGITSPLLLAGHMRAIFNSGSTDGSPEQQFLHNDTCLGWQDPVSGHPVYPARGVNPWICGLAEAYGLPRAQCHACVVLLAPLSASSNVSLDIATGNAKDCISSLNGRTAVSFASGTGEVAYAVGPSAPGATMTLHAEGATGHPVKVLASTSSANISLFLPESVLDRSAPLQTWVTLMSEDSTSTPGIVVAGHVATAAPFDASGSRLTVFPTGPGAEFKSAARARCGTAGACAADLAPPWC
jgi:hypothetical protein